MKEKINISEEMREGFRKAAEKEQEKLDRYSKWADLVKKDANGQA